jgi:IS30 family transposase
MWKKLLSELNAAGLSDNEIARRIGVNQSTISRLRGEKLGDTAYSTGVAIHRLHAQVVAQKAAA